MKNSIVKFLFITLSLSFLVGCNIIDEVFNPAPEEQSQEQKDNEANSIANLKNVEHFQNNALAHILEGELNKKGNAVGFHYEGLATKKGEVVPGSETKPNAFGVYEAKVIVSGVAKTSNGGKSTFFPKNWTAQQVVDAINEAYEDRAFITGNTYEGLTKEGMVIQMYLNNNDKIISAFPIY